jgi:hypothetical protein
MFDDPHGFAAVGEGVEESVFHPCKVACRRVRPAAESKPCPVEFGQPPAG